MYQIIPYYRITNNIGAIYGYIASKNATCGRFLRGKYFVGLPNDVLVMMPVDWGARPCYVVTFVKSKIEKI